MGKLEAEERKAAIRAAILRELRGGPSSFSELQVVTDGIGVCSRTLHRHVAAMVDEGLVEVHGKASARTYALSATSRAAHARRAA